MINDTHITDWSTTAASNPPTDGTFIGRDLPKQLRNIKSLSREEYDDRWMAYVGTPTYLSATTFSFPTNVASAFPALMKLRLHAGTGALTYSMVVSAVFSSVTTITVINLSGTVPTSLQRVDIGMDPGVPAYPPKTARGTVTISETDDTASVDLTALSIEPFPRPDYMVQFTLTTLTGSPAAGSKVIKGYVAVEDGFDLELLAAPGAGTSVTFDWTILFPWHMVSQ